MLDELSDVDIWDMVETGREEAPRCLNTGSGSESWSAVPGWKLTRGGGGARTSGSKLNTQSSSPPQLSSLLSSSTKLSNDDLVTSLSLATPAAGSIFLTILNAELSSHGISK